MTKLPALGAITTLADLDVLYTVDVSDTTDDPTGSSKKITHSGVRNQSDLWLFPANVAALATLGATHADGDVVFTKGYVSTGDEGQAGYRLDTSGVLGASAENGGTIIATDGPANSYYRMLNTENKYDIRRWGGVVNIASGNQVANDLAFTNMIAANMPEIFLPGPICIGKTITLTDQSINIRGTGTLTANVEAGGLIVAGASGSHDGAENQPVLADSTQTWTVGEWVGMTVTNTTKGESATITANTATTVTGVLSGGADWDFDNAYTIEGTAQSNAVIEVINNEEHIFSSIRFFGHVNNPTSLPVVGIKIVYNSTLGSINQATRIRIENCVWRNTDKNVKSFVNCIKTDFTNTEGGADQWLIDHCTFVNWTEKCIWVQNAQSVNGLITHCMFEGRQTFYEIMPLFGVWTRANTTIRNCFFNRIQNTINVQKANVVSVLDCDWEHCRLLTSNAAESRVEIEGGRYALMSDAYWELWESGVTWKAGTAGNSNGQIVEDSAGAYWKITAGTGPTSGNDSSLGTGSDPGYTYVTNTPNRKMINARNVFFELNRVKFLSQLDIGATRPHLYLGNHSATKGPDDEGLIRIVNNQGLRLTDINAQANKGIPSQATERFTINAHGLQFVWDNEGDTKTGTSGLHDTTENSPVLIDSGEAWTINEWAGMTVTNTTKGESATIVSNTATQVTGVLSGGADWDIGNAYTITREAWKVDQWVPAGFFNAGKEVATGTVTVVPEGKCEIDSTGPAAVTVTLGDGTRIGQQKLFTMIDASASSTVDVTNHTTSDPENFTFNATTDMLLLMWMGSEWATIAATASPT